MADTLPSVERRLDLLLGALDRAKRYKTGLVLFVIYRAESARATFENTLVNRLQAVGQRVRREWFQPGAPPESHDLLARLTTTPPVDDEVIFVYGLQHAFPGLLNSLNYRRELIPDHRWRLLFWALDDEVARVMRDAPDFWAFVNQVLDLPEVPLPEERTQLSGTLAWAGFGSHEIRNLAPAERRARIALRERLLDELPDGDDAQSTRADLHDTLAGLYWADRQFAEAERHAQALLELARQMDDTSLRARAMNALGVIYTGLPTGNREANLQRAIQCYEQALTVYTPDATPRDFAMTQNNLGNAYANLPTGDREANLQHAIQCYEQTLRFRTPDAAPLDFAMTQNNLGNAYQALPTGDREANLARAIQCYQEALTVYTPDAAPLQYATTQNNLGNAYQDLPTGDREANLARAIQCYQEALTVYTPDAAPLQYATTQNNLGNAYQDLQEWDQAEAAYRCALAVNPKDTYALNSLGSLYDDRERFQEAEEIYRQLIQIDPNYAFAYNNLAGICLELGRLDEAAEFYAQRIKLRPQDALNAHVDLGIIEFVRGNEVEANTHFEAALDLWGTAWQWRLQTPAALLENKSIALLGLRRKDEAISTMQDALSQRLPTDTIRLTRYNLWATAHNLPAGLDEIRQLLKNAMEK